MKKLFREAGCVSVRAYIGFNGRYVSMLPEVGALIEFVACCLPRQFLGLRATRSICRTDILHARRVFALPAAGSSHHDGVFGD